MNDEKSKRDVWQQFDNESLIFIAARLYQLQPYRFLNHDRQGLITAIENHWRNESCQNQQQNG